MQGMMGFKRRGRLAAVLGLGLVLGACWPGSKTYFEPSAVGGEISRVCGGGTKEIEFYSSAYPWVAISLHPRIAHNTPLELAFSVSDDHIKLRRHAEAQIPKSDNQRERSNAIQRYANAHSVKGMPVEIFGDVIVSWAPDQRRQFNPNATRVTSPYFAYFSSISIPDFTGDAADIVLPSVSINGTVERFPPVTIKRVTAPTLHGINGCG